METQDKIQMKWKQFHSKTIDSLRRLREDSDYYDVTLVSDDQKQVHAHKFLLSSASGYFRNILRKGDYNERYYIGLEGTSFEEINGILDYIYFGELMLEQRLLPRFLDIAQRLDLEGLTSDDIIEAEEERKGGNDYDFPIIENVDNFDITFERTEKKEENYELEEIEEKEKPEETQTFAKISKIKISKLKSEENMVKEETNEENKEEINEENNEETPEKVVVKRRMRPDGNKIVNSYTWFVGSDKIKTLHELNEVVSTMFIKIERNNFQCKKCLKSYRNKAHIKEHIEIHIKDTQFQCTMCGMLKKSRAQIRAHRITNHKAYME